jgi:ABC-2 type transport system ATP-binding protein
MPEAAIEARGLTKTFRTFDRRPGLLGSLQDIFARRYRELTAVAGVTLSVAPGEAVGYIGPNGAGKSTTIKMLTGIMTPSAGEVRVNGFDPHRERSRYVRTVGAVFGQRSQLWWDLAVGESFELLRHLYDVPKKDFDERLARFDQVLGLQEFIRTPVRKLSLGQRMKADLAASLLHDPRVLFLDEPTVGVDVVTKSRLREFLRELNRERRTTILLTTHDMQDIEALCSRVVVIDHGKIMHDGDLGGLRERYGGSTRLLLTLKSPVELAKIQPELPREGVAWSQTNPVELAAALAATIEVPQLLQACFAKLPVADVAIEEPTIEEVVKQLYGGRSG